MFKLFNLFLIISFLSAFQNSIDPITHRLEFVTEDDKIAKLIERLYLSSGHLPLEIGSFYTISDVEEDLAHWKILYQTPSIYQFKIINEIELILNTIQ